MADPYLEFLATETDRVESDLASFRQRSLTVLTTSTSVVALITASITFGSSETESKAGIPNAAIAIFALSIGCFVAATVLALLANRSAKVKRPTAASLKSLTTTETWNNDVEEHERYVASTYASFIESMHGAIDAAAEKLNCAIGLQIAGLSFGAGAGILTAAALNN